MALQAQEQVLDQDSDFEFGCITPDSPSTDPNKDSPADLLFFNGRLLPHAFPSESRKSISIDYSTSRTSSIGSKGSLMSSRSNSSNSRSSSSSGRTSLSDCHDKRPWNNSENVGTTNARITRARSLRTGSSARLQTCPSGQKWQFIAPAPCLASSSSSPVERKREKFVVQQELGSQKLVKQSKEGSSLSQRLIKSFLLGCRKCHALEPSLVQD